MHDLSATLLRGHQKFDVVVDRLGINLITTVDGGKKSNLVR